MAKKVKMYVSKKDFKAISNAVEKLYHLREMLINLECEEKIIDEIEDTCDQLEELLFNYECTRDGDL